MDEQPSGVYRDPRRDTEEAARTGRFPDPDGTVDDDSNPIEPEAPVREGADEMPADGTPAMPNEQLMG
jgi:hypothetical protein